MTTTASTRELHFTVPGHAAPQGSKRHVGRGVLIESSKRLAPWRETVLLYADQAKPADWVTLDGPVAVGISFYFTRPASAPKRRPWSPTTRSSGDIDKLCRAVLDALAAKTGAGIFRDDSQVVRLSAVKLESTAPGADITVTEVAR